MLLLVTHLTRMQPGYFCVAGVDIETARHVRPVLAQRRLPTQLLHRNGGPFELGAVVDLGVTRPVGAAPELEDHLFDPRRASRKYVPNASDYWEFLGELSHPTLAAIFGDHLRQAGHSCTVDVGGGSASLGCLKPQSPPHLHFDPSGRLRLSLTEGAHSLDLSVTDLRFYRPDHQTPRGDLIEHVARRIRDGEAALIGVGLTRPWQRGGDATPRHWLQVNNLHLEASPIWNDTPA